MLAIFLSSAHAASLRCFATTVFRPAAKFCASALAATCLILGALSASAQTISFAGVQGGSTSIANFGSVNVCGLNQSTPPCGQTLTLNYNVASGTTIGAVRILTQGTANLDFKLQANDSSTTLCAPQTYNSPVSCTLDLTFAPIAPGARNGAVQFLDASGNLLLSTFIYGIGVSPAFAYPPPARHRF